MPDVFTVPEEITFNELETKIRARTVAVSSYCVLIRVGVSISCTRSKKFAKAATNVANGRETEPTSTLKSPKQIMFAGRRRAVVIKRSKESKKETEERLCGLYAVKMINGFGNFNLSKLVTETPKASRLVEE